MPVITDKTAKLQTQIYSRFNFLYDDKIAEQCIKRLKNLLAKYNFDLEKSKSEREGWDETDTILITYGDVIKSKTHPDKPQLQLLESFLQKYVQNEISTVHILPFFSSSSDGGFSIMDYREIRDELGDWKDIEHLSSQFQLMIDLVINHVSRSSKWFLNYQKGKKPGKDYFIEVESGKDLSKVTRPRNSPLLTAVPTNRGLRHVWTTFSDDQIDLDFSNPDVLFEFIDIFLFYYAKGARVFRLDAIAYLWKKIGTSSIHLRETHEVVKLFRDLTECIDPGCTLITETNVPFNENINYFGDEDEAHMIYQFSLPPLLLHAILTENSRYLTKWALELPDIPDDCLYFNFTSSHDGIGVRPLEGLVPVEEFAYLINSTEDRGGFVSYKQNPDGGQSPYELNITYFDAFEQPGNPRSELQMQRYMCSQIIMLSLKGVPGIYFHNLTATKNNVEGVAKSGKKRDINRKQWDWQELQECLEDTDDIAHITLMNYKIILQKRKNHPAFHPSAKQKILDSGGNFFSFVRTALDGEEKILVISNVSSNKVHLNVGKMDDILVQDVELWDIIGESKVQANTDLKLSPFQTMWLKF